ncbi:MAG: PIN domain-containing protein [Campylobacterota bacterium]|nr:PIN domain-containing protein [Campylobacterota bacterium]
MYKSVFVDANILVDYIDASRKSHSYSVQTLHHLLSNNVSVLTSCDIITTIYYLYAKKDKNQALLEIERINQFCKVINFSNHEVTLTCKLMHKDTDYHDLEDTLQYILAQKEQCELIISNDKNFTSKAIALMSSENFLEKIINA